MTALETRLDAILPTLATKADVAELRGDMEKDFLRIDSKFEALRGDMEKGFLRIDSKFEELRGDMEKRFLHADTKFEGLRGDMHKMNAEIKTWTLATMITIVGTMLAAIFGISQIYKSAAPASTAAQPAPIVINIPGSSVPAAAANSR